MHIRLRRLIIIFIFLCILLVEAGCSPQPILPDDVALELHKSLGYALAPTYLPRGFEYDMGMDEARYVLGNPPFAHLVYSSYQHGMKNRSLGMSYPVNFSLEENSVAERLGLEIPEETLTEVRVQGKTAYLVRGTWSAETMHRFFQLIEPIDAEWDYRSRLSVYFSIDLPTGESTPVMLYAELFPSGWITEEELLRIAESVRIVETVD
jgi:hypothetical protein